jgi:hypothetical protein
MPLYPEPLSETPPDGNWSPQGWEDNFSIPDGAVLPSFQKFQYFVQDEGRKLHNLNSDTLKVSLTNVAPDLAANRVLADLTEIATGHGYSAGGAAVGSTGYAQTGGNAALTGSNVTFTASGGNIASFRYAVLYNSTASGGPLIGMWDYGSSIVISGTFTVSFGANILSKT